MASNHGYGGVGMTSTMTVPSGPPGHVARAYEQPPLRRDAELSASRSAGGPSRSHDREEKTEHDRSRSRSSSRGGGDGRDDRNGAPDGGHSRSHSHSRDRPTSSNGHKADEKSRSRSRSHSQHRSGGGSSSGSGGSGSTYTGPVPDSVETMPEQRRTSETLRDSNGNKIDLYAARGRPFECVGASARHDIAMATTTGRRQYQEDRVGSKLCAKGPFKNTQINMVFDGHGGKHVSELLSHIFADNVFKAISSGKIAPPTDRESPEMFRRQMDQIIDAEFVRTDRLLHTESKKDGDKWNGCGSTGSGVLIIGQHLVLVNLGDSRTVVFGLDNGCVFLETKDHKPEDDKERIAKHGGFVSAGDTPRVNGSLAMSHAFGDFNLKIGSYMTKQDERRERYEPRGAPVIAKPAVLHFQMPPFGVPVLPGPGAPPTIRFGVIVGSDGLWDKMTSADAARIYIHHKTRTNSVETATRELVKEAFNRGSSDNITAVVIELYPNELKAFLRSGPSTTVAGPSGSRPTVATSAPSTIPSTAMTATPTAPSTVPQPPSSYQFRQPLHHPHPQYQHPAVPHLPSVPPLMSPQQHYQAQMMHQQQQQQQQQAYNPYRTQ